MVGSTSIASDSHHQQFHDQLMDGAAGDHQSSGVVFDEDDPSFSGVTCSICLDSVADNAVRSIAKLQCGHRFHLDCIGSAFNIKGSMQCPNCRKVEKGQWLYANGSTRSVPEISMDEWIPDEEFYDIGYPEMPFRFHWCPYGELARAGSTFEEVDSPSNTYHELRGHHSAYAEHVALSSVVHSYVALVGPVPPNSSRSSDSIDDPNFNHRWNGQSGRHEIFNAHPFPAISIPFHGWGRRSPLYTVTRGHINGVVDPASVPLTFRLSNGETDARTRPAPFPHPVMFGLGSAPIAGRSFVSSIVPRHPGSSARVQISRAFHHRQQAGSPPGVPSPIIHSVRRYDDPRGLPALVPAPQPDHSGGFLMVPPTAPAQTPQEPENPLLNHFHVWEREPLPRLQPVPFERDLNWGPFGHRQPTGFWHRHSP